MALLSLPVLLPAPRAIDRARSAARNLPIQELMTEADVAFLAAQDGPALCERPALCFWAGKRFEVDLFNSGQKFRSGALDPSEIEALLEQRYFAVLQLSQPRPSLPNSALELLPHHYQVVRRSPRTAFWLPRGMGEARSDKPASPGPEASDD